MSAPALSVLMPVYNAGAYLAESIESILGQTFEDLELVILENGSTDRSRAIARSYEEADPRVRVVEHPDRLGVVASRNRIVAEASASLVAHMDADDVSLPTRLERQVDVMRALDAVAVGTLATGIDSRGRSVRPRDRWRLVRCSEMPFSNGSAMFWREAFDRAGGFRSGPRIGTDVEFFSRLREYGRIVVLPEALYRYRYHPGSATMATNLAEMKIAKEGVRRALPEARADTLAAALYYQGSMRLWAGEPIGVLGAVARSSRLAPRWVKTFVWATWGALSPATLRASLRGFVRARDLLAGLRIKDGRVYEWRLS